MANLTDSKLDDFVRHARESHLAHNPRPLLADRVELLVAEVRRLREGIARHRDEGHELIGHLTHPADERLWALLGEDDSDG
jgi:anti-sigma factor RsiW